MSGAERRRSLVVARGPAPRPARGPPASAPTPDRDRRVGAARRASASRRSAPPPAARAGAGGAGAGSATAGSTASTGSTGRGDRRGCVERAEREGLASLGGDPTGHRRDVAEVADAPAGRGPGGGHLHRDAPLPQVVRQVAAPRAHDEGGHRPAVERREVVDPEREVGGEPVEGAERRRHPPAAGGTGCAGRRRRPGARSRRDDQRQGRPWRRAGRRRWRWAPRATSRPCRPSRPRCPSGRSLRDPSHPFLLELLGGHRRRPSCRCACRARPWRRRWSGRSGFGATTTRAPARASSVGAVGLGRGPGRTGPARRLARGCRPGPAGSAPVDHAGDRRRGLVGAGRRGIGRVLDGDGVIEDVQQVGRVQRLPGDGPAAPRRRRRRHRSRPGCRSGGQTP